LGCIEYWCRAKSYPVTYTDFFEDDYSLPSPDDYDVLVIMGGPMGIYDEIEFPWLKKEKKHIKEAIEKEKTVIGICLGSQLIADTLGARVYRNKEKEIGWWRIRLTEDALEIAPFNFFEKEFTVFQWHGDTFDLPKEAIRIASSGACINQAYIYKNKVLGLQFHFEVTADSIKTLSENDLEEILKGGNFVQSAEEIHGGDNFIESNNRMMFKILDEIIG
jgi:GMP synthase-like glutamine amidotransferase